MENSKKFNVTICYEGAISYKVVAENEEDARQKAVSLFKEEDKETVYNGIYNRESDYCEEIEELESSEESSELTTQENDETHISKLKDFEPGDTIELGNYKFTILEQFENSTALVSKTPVKEMPFGKTGDYKRSSVRTFCNTEFLKKIADIIGEENIVPQTISFNNSNISWKDKVSILTDKLFCKYKEYLPSSYNGFWVATEQANNPDLDTLVGCCCELELCGIDCKCSAEVYPYIILNSSVSCKEEEYIPFGDECEITKPDADIDCSSLGYFDELEYDCMDLICRYAEKFGLKIRSTDHEETPMTFDLAKSVEERIFEIFENNGVNLKFE